MFENAPNPVIVASSQMESSRTIPSGVATKANRKILFLDPAKVVTVEAQGNYVLLRGTSGSAFLLRQPVSTVAEKLLPYGFRRIHRSALINAAFVEEIQSWTVDEYILRIKGGKEFHVSRTFHKNLRFLTHSGLLQISSHPAETSASPPSPRVPRKESRK
jgi:DNA-binding LytR/AlgR family response regulator